MDVAEAPSGVAETQVGREKYFGISLSRYFFGKKIQEKKRNLRYKVKYSGRNLGRDPKRVKDQTREMTTLHYHNPIQTLRGKLEREAYASCLDTSSMVSQSFNWIVAPTGGSG